MAGVRNVRNNSGIIAGGNVSGSSVVNNTAKGAASEDEMLEELNDLVADLLKAVRQLSPEDRGVVRAEVVELQEAIEAPARDRGRITASLDKLKSVVAVAAPLAEIVKDIAGIAIELVG